MYKSSYLKDVSIIIVNYNTLKLTKNCINSIFKNTQGINYEIILVDNASNDGSIQHFRLNKRIIFIENHENLGFGRANNVGLEVAQGKYFFLLNPDTILLGNVIKDLFDFAETHSELNIGALGTLLIDKQYKINKPFLYFPSLHLIHINNLRRFRIKDSYKDTLQLIETNNFAYVECISGANLFIPSSIIDIIGGFDPAIFMYADETDLQKRMENKGFKRLIINNKKIIHFGGKSFNNKTYFKKYTIQQSSLWYYARKHMMGLEYFIFRCIKIFAVLTHVFIIYRHLFSKKEKFMAVKQAVKGV